jgi:hypothetical protein
VGEIEARIQEMKRFKEMYDKPLVNAAITFIEPFPIGLVITVLSAAILRKRTKVTAGEQQVVVGSGL